MSSDYKMANCCLWRHFALSLKGYFYIRTVCEGVTRSPVMWLHQWTAVFLLHSHNAGKMGRAQKPPVTSLCLYTMLYLQGQPDRSNVLNIPFNWTWCPVALEAFNIFLLMLM